MTEKILLTQKGNRWVSCEEFLKNFNFSNKKFESIENIKADSDFFEINIENACVFRYIFSRHTFEYDIYRKISEEAWKEILTRYILPICFCDMGWLVLHATQIASQNTGFSFMILGPSGVGKSTLTYDFFKSGYEVLSDDMVVLDRRCQSRWYNPYVKLTKDACNHFSVRYTEKTNKERILISRTYLEKQTECRRLFILDPVDERKREIEIMPIIGLNKIIKLYPSFYNNDIISPEIRRKQMSRLMEISSQLDVYRIHYEKKYENIKNIKEAIR
ncbi:MAG: hypothetical protein HFH95_14960 [Lachnospiraceae bacterium]|nr:hypothetical protein [Lachnospiraceae bacterium]